MGAAASIPQAGSLTAAEARELVGEGRFSPTIFAEHANKEGRISWETLRKLAEEDAAELLPPPLACPTLAATKESHSWYPADDVDGGRSSSEVGSNPRTRPSTVFQCMLLRD